MANESKAVSGGQSLYEEIDNDDPYTFTVSRSGRSDVRHFYVSNANLPTLRAELFPGGAAFPGQHPSVSYLFADSLEVRGFGKAAGVDSNGVAYWDRWVANVTYTPLPAEEQEQQSGETFLTRRKTFGAEYMTLPGATLKWQDTGNRIKEDEVVAAKLIPMIEHVLTLHRVPDIDEDLIRDCVGKVNDAEFEGADAEGMLFIGADTSFQWSTDGSQIYTVEFRFQEKLIKSGASTYGWNHFFRPGDGAWKKIVNDADETIYPTTNKFKQLLLM